MKKMIFLKVKNSYNKKLVTWLDLNLQVALNSFYIYLDKINNDLINIAHKVNIL